MKGGRMAKFGRFECGGTQPIETYEGDFMRSESAYVRIFKGGDPVKQRPECAGDSSRRETETTAQG
jgi:hypothetical protein